MSAKLTKTTKIPQVFLFGGVVSVVRIAIARDAVS
jgi:hypothetical protein